MNYKNLKPILATAFCVCTGLSAYSQKEELWSDIPVLFDAWGHKISADGSFSTGEAVTYSSSWGRNNVTGETYMYESVSCGDGNNISKDHIVVGTDQLYMKAAFLLPKADADPVLVSTLEKYSDSYLHGITWDGSRIVGIVANPQNSDADEFDPELQQMMYLPVVCDVEPGTTNASEPVFLPTPPRDFFGMVPQYCTAVWISDDGMTVLGQVIDNTGYFIYPIVYKQAASGEWSYSLPTEDMFDYSDRPVYPTPEMKVPNPADYIGNPEMKALFEELLKAYLKDPSSDDPFEMLDPSETSDALMTEQEWNAYSEAIVDYQNYILYVYSPEVDKYYEEYSKFIAKATNFLQSSMSMNRAGTMISQTKVTTRYSGSTAVKLENPMVFNLSDGTSQTFGGDFYEMEINQILSDGTLIAATPQPSGSTPDLTPKHSYVCKPGGTEFVPIEDYIKASNPELYAWYQEYLFHDVPVGYGEDGGIVSKEMTVTGLVAVSDDFTALSGGVDGWSWDYENGDYFTYFFTDMVSPDAGVESLFDNDSDTITVYNLQGVKMLKTNSASDLNSLPRGIYVANGKKIMVK